MTLTTMVHKKSGPVPSASMSASEWAARHYGELLASCNKAWRNGVSLAIADAVAICESYRQPPPKWLVEAVAAIVMKQQSPHEKRRRQEDMKHFVRWDMVIQLRERGRDLFERFGHDRDSSWERTYAAVSEALKDTEAAGGDAAIKASYQHVQRQIKAGRGNRFLILDRRTDPDSKLLESAARRREKFG